MVECISTPFDLFYSSLALNPASHQRGRNKGFLPHKGIKDMVMAIKAKAKVNPPKAREIRGLSTGQAK